MWFCEYMIVLLRRQLYRETIVIRNKIVQGQLSMGGGIVRKPRMTFEIHIHVHVFLGPAIKYPILDLESFMQCRTPNLKY